MKTTTEEAREIRAAYKRRGWSSRMISVRTDYFSMGSAIHVTIKSPGIDESEAERIAKGAERISRCEITGEILSGGNTYVSVNHSEECREILARRHTDALEKAIKTLVRIGDRNRLEQIAGAGDACVGLENGRARLWIGSRMAMEFYPGNESGIQSGAFHLARLLAREASAERLGLL